jgi:hypothetical protein
MYEVVEAMRWVHKDGRTASVYGSLPYWGENDGWEIKKVGYTAYHPNSNTYGCGCPVLTTVENVQAWIASVEKLSKR